MFTDPCMLIDETLDHLQTLSVLFADESDERVRHAGDNESTAKLCREVQSDIDALIPKLMAARVTQQPQRQTPLCLNCDE